MEFARIKVNTDHTFKGDMVLVEYKNIYNSTVVCQNGEKIHSVNNKDLEFIGNEKILEILNNITE